MEIESNESWLKIKTNLCYANNWIPMYSEALFLFSSSKRIHSNFVFQSMVVPVDKLEWLMTLLIPVDHLDILRSNDEIKILLALLWPSEMLHCGWKGKEKQKERIKFAFIDFNKLLIFLLTCLHRYRVAIRRIYRRSFLLNSESKTEIIFISFENEKQEIKNLILNFNVFTMYN